MAIGLLPPTSSVSPDDVSIGGCSLTQIASDHGTPAYLVDEVGLRERARRWRAAFADRHPNSLVVFASKSFPSVSVLRVLAQEGIGADVVGRGELLIAQRAGMPSDRIVMHGNAKSDDDIRAAIEARIRYIVLDGADELARIVRIGAELNAPPTPVLVRVRPGVAASTHEALATGGDRSKFGVAMSDAPAMIERLQREPRIDLRGLHLHIGSGITALDQFATAIAKLASLPRFGVYDLGGGLGIAYEAGDLDPSIEDFAQTLISSAREHFGDDVEVLAEPGRAMVGPIGATLYRVLTVKRGLVTHVAVDGGMGDNLENSLYGQRFSPVLVGGADRPRERVTLVGRHCEEGDVIVSDVDLPRPEVGDLIVVPVTGAYCFTMSNNYNAALRPPVLFCGDGRVRVGVRRETYEDLFARELD